MKLKILVALCALLAPLCVLGQTPTSTPAYQADPVAAFPATTWRKTFWWNLDPDNFTNESMYQAAAASGAGGVRITCGWEQSETFNALPSNTHAAYVLQSSCATAFALAAKYNLGVSVTLTYQPPWRLSAYVTPTNDIKVGDTTVNLTLVNGLGGWTWSNITPGKTTLCNGVLSDSGSFGDGLYCTPPTSAQVAQSYTGAFANTRKTYNGALITAVNVIDATHASVTVSMSAKAQQIGAVDPTVSIPALSKTVTGCQITAGSYIISGCPTGTFDTTMPNSTQIVITNAGRCTGGCQTPADNKTAIIKSVQSDTQATMSTSPFNTEPTTVTFTRLLAINDQMYAPPQSVAATDPGNMAMANVAAFVGGQAKTAGVPFVAIEVENEVGLGFPDWHDPNSYYDYASGGNWLSTTSFNTVPGGLNVNTTMRNGTCYISLVDNNKNNDPATTTGYWSTTIPPNAFCGAYASLTPPLGMMGAIQSISGTTWPAGVEAWYEGTWNTGFGSSLTQGYMSQSGVNLPIPATNVMGEIWHPYSAFPEEKNGANIGCLNQILAGTRTNYYECNVAGSTGSGNTVGTVVPEFLRHAQNPGDNFHGAITETGNVGPMPGTESKTFVTATRQIFMAQSDNVYPVELFQLFNEHSSDINASAYPGQTYSWLSMTAEKGGTVAATYQQYKAIQALSNYIAPIANTPIANHPTSDMPSLTATSGGEFPLLIYHMYGPRAGGTKDSIATFVMQHTTNTSMTASANSGVLTVTAFGQKPGQGTPPYTLNAQVKVGDYLLRGSCQESAVTASCTQITSQLSGTPGGIGTYQLSNPDTFASTSGLMTIFNMRAAPPAETATFTILPGYQVTGVFDPYANAPVSYTTASNTVSFPVQENPVILLQDPVTILGPILGHLGNGGIQGRRQ